MDKGSKLIFESKPSFISFWNRYYIYEDRIELEAKFLFRKFVINKDQLVSIEVFPPPVMKTNFWALKLDCADLREHVGIERTNGFMKNLRFTPENPKEFVAKVAETFKSEAPARKLAKIEK